MAESLRSQLVSLQSGVTVPSTFEINAASPKLADAVALLRLNPPLANLISAARCGRLDPLACFLCSELMLEGASLVARRSEAEQAVLRTEVCLSCNPPPPPGLPPSTGTPTAGPPVFNPDPGPGIEIDPGPECSPDGPAPTAQDLDFDPDEVVV